VQVAGIGTTKTGYVIRFKDAASAALARNNKDWLIELGNDARLVIPLEWQYTTLPPKDWTSKVTKQAPSRKSLKTTSRNVFPESKTSLG
jgi:hypothetical protein